ncbi:hypothetical protein LWM68_39970 [Niabella sp. W65]|nr:hypothetical protein [Niabella sp. W65]MCH7368374.1 hypothetical protein [Niabella sp. W65]ULT43972.1 hypothetical protein KRR40_11650 [Niabella sp. I65]
MEQKIFSEYAFDFLAKNFPEFLPAVKYNGDESFECDLKNNSGKFSMWIATYNSEITFGLETPDGKTDVHTHVSCLEIAELEDCFATLTGLIYEITNHRVILYQTEQGTYDWTDYEKLLKEENKKKRTFEKFFW